MDSRFIRNCESENLAGSRAIQTHGALLIVKDGAITDVSSNLSDYLGICPESILGKPLEPPFRSVVEAFLASKVDRHFETHLVVGPKREMDCYFTRGRGGECLVEIYPPVIRVTHQPSLRDHAVVERISTDSGLDRSASLIVERVHQVFSSTRTLYYRFCEDGDGEVILERRTSHVAGSFVGLRFPASDIPQVARTIYVRTPWRLIFDAQQDPVSVLSFDGGCPDLSMVDLRSVSPIHRIYLSNMGLRSSLSFPVVVGGKLYALVTAHQDQVHRQALPDLVTVAEEVKQHGRAVGMYLAEERIKFVDGLSRAFEQARMVFYRHGSLESAWSELSRQWMDLFEVDGIALVSGQSHCVAGIDVEPETVSGLVTAMLQVSNEPIQFWQSVTREVEGIAMSEVAGAIGISFGGVFREPAYLFLLRGEHIHEISWGGNPNKPVEYVGQKLTVSPRHSFERWIESRIGYCRPWGDRARLLSLRLYEFLKETATQ